MKWSEGHIHLAMRKIVSDKGWALVAGEFPGGSDHDLYPLNVVDPSVAKDRSPDPRRHSQGEMIPDLIAVSGRRLFIGEAKVNYDEDDRSKLEHLVANRRPDLLLALRKFAEERKCPQLLPVETLVLFPSLVFRAESLAPLPPPGMSYLRVQGPAQGFFEGALKD